MKKAIKIILFVGIPVLLAIAAWAVLKGKNGNENGIVLIEVTQGNITEKAVAVGQVEPRFQFRVKSKISGIVKRCMVEVGDEVKEGTPLFEIAPDPTPFELTEVNRTLEGAKAAYAKAQADHRRVEELVQKGILSESELDASKASHDQAKVSLERASDNRELTRKGRIAGGGAQMESIIRAQASGIVLTRSVDPGDPVVPLTSYQPGTELAVIADMGDLIFKGTVDEIDVGKLQAGLPTRLKIGALPDAVVTGRLSRIAPKAREVDNARLFDVEIELDPTQDVKLRAGYSANADVVIREKNEVLIIPERLVIFEGDEEQTFVEIPGPNPESEPQKVEVVTGLSDGLNIEIAEGLALGDQVVQRPPREI